MPLTKKGKEIMKSMKEEYGKKKGESIFYASKNKGTIKGVEKASKGKMMKVEKVKGALEKASKLHAAQAKTLGSVLKAAGGGLKEATKRLKAQGYKGGNMANLKPVPADKQKSLGQLPEDVRNKMGYAKKGKIMKASMGKSVRGYGAARTSGMGLEDQELPPGKSLDYYKDVM